MRRASTEARDAEMGICQGDTLASSPRAAAGYLAAERAVLRAVADDLDSLGFECAVRKTARRSTQSSVVRVDQAFDLVAWRPGDDPSRTVAVAISYDAPVGADSVVGGLWPAAVTVEALRALKVEGFRNDIVVSIGSSNEWRVFNSVLRDDPPTAPDTGRHSSELEVAGAGHPAAPAVFFESPGWMVGFIPGAEPDSAFPFPTSHQPLSPMPSEALGKSSSSSPSAFARPTMEVLQSVRIDADEDRRPLLSASANRFFAALRTAADREDSSDVKRSLLWLLIIVLPVALLLLAARVVHARARIRLVEANNAIRRMESWLAVRDRLVRWRNARHATVRRTRRLRPIGPGFSRTVRPYGTWLCRYVAWTVRHLWVTAVWGIPVVVIRVAAMFGSYRSYRHATGGRCLPADIAFMKKRNIIVRQNAEDDYKKGVASVAEGWSSLPKALVKHGNGKWVAVVGFVVTLAMAGIGMVCADKTDVTNYVANVVIIAIRAVALFVILFMLASIIYDIFKNRFRLASIKSATSKVRFRWFALGCAIAVYSGLTTLKVGPLADLEEMVDPSILTATFVLVAIVLGLCEMFDRLDKIDKDRIESRSKTEKMAEEIVGISKQVTIASRLRSLVFQWDRGRAAMLSVVVLLSYLVWVSWFVVDMMEHVRQGAIAPKAGAVSLIATTAAVLVLPAVALLVSAFNRSENSASWILLIPVLAAGCGLWTGGGGEVEVGSDQTGLVTSAEIDWHESGDSILWKAGSDYMERTAVPRIGAGMDLAFEPPTLEHAGTKVDSPEERKTVRLRIRKSELRGQVLRMRAVDSVSAWFVSVDGEAIADSVRADSVEMWEATGRADAELTLKLPRCHSVALDVEEIRTGVDEALVARLGPLPSTFGIGDSSAVLVTGRITLRQDWELPKCCDQTLAQRAQVGAATAEPAPGAL